MRPDIEQRAEAMQTMIASSKLDNTTKTLLAQNLAQSAEATNGMTQEGKIQALTVNTYQLSESVALLAIQVSNLPCHGALVCPSPSPSATSSASPSAIASKCDVWGTVYKCRWATFALVSVIYLGILISPAMQTLADKAVDATIQAQAKAQPQTAKK